VHLASFSKLLVGAALVAMLYAAPARAVAPVDYCNPKVRCVRVAEAFLEMHSGAGRGFPVFHVVGRGDLVQVLKRRTDWFLVRTDRQIEGWVSREQMLATQDLSGAPFDINEPDRNDYTTRRFEAGQFVGRFGGATLVSVFGAYGISEHLSLELHLGGAPGNISNSLFATLGINHTFAPEWWLSPYAGIGTGVINTSPRVTLVNAPDSTDQLAYATAGVRVYIARRFLARFEYRANVILTSRDQNEEIDEWKLGFAFFF
jgi:uncharacterized protein YgiM (DUF1202 family)